MENDHQLDQRAMDDFVTFMGYSPKQYWDIVEKYWNPGLFEKVNHVWQIKNPVSNTISKKG